MNEPATEKEIHQEEIPKGKRSRKKWIGLLALLLIAVISGLAIQHFNSDDSDLEVGSVDWDQPENLQEIVNQAVEDNMVNIFMNTNIYMKNGSDEANLLIQNADTNPNPIQVDLKDKNTGELLYSSETIPIGYKIESAPLLVNLDAGVYDCEATFTIYKGESDEVINRINLNVTVTVEN